jgi:peptidoglycan/LPS O-acetylase OafA/YrhL
LWLDSLRGVAALMVAAGHMTWIPTNASQLQALGKPEVDYPTINLDSWNFLVSLTVPSNSWVMVFFLLSGFVLESSIERTRATIFAKRRLLRLWIPAIVAQLIFFFVGVLFLERPYTFVQLISSLPLINGGLPGMIGGTLLLPVVWTLFYEARYAVVLFICKFLGVRPQTRLLLGILIAFSYSLMGQLFVSNLYSLELANILLGHAFISIGGIFWHLYNSKMFSKKFFFLLFISYYFFVRYSLEGPFNFSERSMGLALFLFILCLFLEHKEFATPRFLSSMGKYSYSIYLVHFIFGVQVYVFLLPILNVPLSILVSTVSCLVGVSLFHVFVEKPVLKLITKINS